MDIRLHIGAHRTATQHLRQMLENNRALLESQGICLADAKVAEQAFAASTVAVRSGTSQEDANAQLVETLTGGGDFRRIIVIDPNISGTVLRPVGKEFFYPRIGRTILRIKTALHEIPMRLCISVRNPANFIPACYAESLQLGNRDSYETYIEETNLQRLRWSDFLQRAQLKEEDIPVTAWRLEDYPFIWRDVAQAITGLENKEDLVGSTDPVNTGLSLKGAILMQTYLTDHPVQTSGEFAKVQAAFEEKFPSTGESIYNPTWPEELTIGMTENYDDDWYYIERMENVETVQPRTFV